MKRHKHQKVYDAFDLFAKKQNEQLPDEKALAAITFSDEFQMRMQLLLRRQKHGFFVFFGTAGRRVASILIAILVAATVTTVSVEALREPVFQFFTEVFEKFTQILFVDDTPDTSQVEMEKRLPTYIPDGFTLKDETDLVLLYKTTYTNPQTEDIIRYSQKILRSGELLADTEYTQYTTILIGDRYGITYENKGVVYIVISDEHYTYTFSGTISLDDLILMAESIKIK